MATSLDLALFNFFLHSSWITVPHLVNAFYVITKNEVGKFLRYLVTALTGFHREIRNCSHELTAIRPRMPDRRLILSELSTKLFHEIFGKMF
jgi:hypothetical protein